MARRVLIDPCLDVESIRQRLADLPLAVEPLERPAGDDVLAVVAWDCEIGAAELARLPNARLVMTPSVGFDHIDLDAARRHGGVRVCHVPDYCFEEMADTTVALALALLRGIVALDRQVAAGGWDATAAPGVRRVAGTRLGVVGYGLIGSAVARRAQALGFAVWAADPGVPAAAMRGAGVRPAALDELLAACHVVSLHVPLTKATARLIGAAQIARMPRGSFLVNTARGGLLDTQAALDALASGHLAGAALDVLEVEPPTAEHPPPRAPNLIVTPHSAYQGPQAEEELHRRVADAVRLAVAGEAPPNALV